MKIIPTRKYRIEPISNRGWFSLHTHSRYSVNDAMSPVQDLVAGVAAMGQPAVGIMDHGNMAASVELYQACMKHGIAPFPGSEMYFVPDTDQYRADRANKHIKATMYHLGVVAYTSKGYEHLVNLSTASHRNHHYKPLVDYTMLAQFAEDGRPRG